MEKQEPQSIPFCNTQLMLGKADKQTKEFKGNSGLGKKWVIESFLLSNAFQ